jgi:hypothetical protein
MKDFLLSEDGSSSGGVGICMVLFLIFLILKLTGHITWSWVWVTSPLWIGTAVVLTVLAVMLLLAYLFD